MDALPSSERLRLDSIEDRHGYIEYEDIRNQLGSSVYSCLTSSHSANHLATVARQKLTDVLKYLAVVIS